MVLSAADEVLDVPVSLGDRSYAIRVVSDRFEQFAPFFAECLQGRSCRFALIVTDSHLEETAKRYEQAIRLLGVSTALAVVPSGESSKGLEQLSRLLDQLVDHRADRQSCVVAVGGGVIGDLAGFAAASYARGIALMMVPTSLLAQVDSSVGGKTGVNHPRAKNIIGAFHQPRGVWIDTAHLQTLPPREVRCGLAEVVKYGVILDSEFFETLERQVQAIRNLEPSVLRAIVARSCELKAMVVSQDEREETGLRAVLNFGHTIGHGVEAAAGYGDRYQHGEAVAIGMVAECWLAERLGWIEPSVTARLEALLTAFGLPVRAPGLGQGAIIDAMTRDKKNKGGKVRCVLPRRIGAVELTDAAGPEDLRAVLERMTAI